MTDITELQMTVQRLAERVAALEKVLSHLALHPAQTETAQKLAEEMIAAAEKPALVSIPSILGVVTSAQMRPADCPRANCCGSAVQLGASSVSVCGLVGCKHNHNPTHGGCGTDRVSKNDGGAE